jgi:hypothetical protein
MDTFTKVLNTKGLYKRQQKDSSSWVVKGRIKGGKVVTVTIGDTRLYKQAEAKQKTLDILKMMSEGINPNEAKKAEQEINRLARLYTRTSVRRMQQIISVERLHQKRY